MCNVKAPTGAEASSPSGVHIDAAVRSATRGTYQKRVSFSDSVKPRADAYRSYVPGLSAVKPLPIGNADFSRMVSRNMVSDSSRASCPERLRLSRPSKDEEGKGSADEPKR